VYKSSPGTAETALKPAISLDLTWKPQSNALASAVIAVPGKTRGRGRLDAW